MIIYYARYMALFSFFVYLPPIWIFDSGVFSLRHYASAVYWWCCFFSLPTLLSSIERCCFRQKMPPLIIITIILQAPRFSARHFHYFDAIVTYAPPMILFSAFDDIYLWYDDIFSWYYWLFSLSFHYHYFFINTLSRHYYADDITPRLASSAIFDRLRCHFAYYYLIIEFSFTRDYFRWCCQHAFIFALRAIYAIAAFAYYVIYASVSRLMRHFLHLRHCRSLLLEDEIIVDITRWYGAFAYWAGDARYAERWDDDEMRWRVEEDDAAIFRYFHLRRWLPHIRFITLGAFMRYDYCRYFPCHFSFITVTMLITMPFFFARYFFFFSSFSFRRHFICFPMMPRWWYTDVFFTLICHCWWYWCKRCR